MSQLEALGRYDSISNTSREILRDGTPKAGFVTPNPSHEKYDYEVTGRNERLATSAVLIKHITDVVLENARMYPPYGLMTILPGTPVSENPYVPVTEFDCEAPFDQLRDDLAGTFTATSLREKKAIKEHPESYPKELVSAMTNYRKWATLGGVSGGIGKIQLENGFETGATFITDIQRAIPLTLNASGFEDSAQNIDMVLSKGYELVRKAMNLDRETFIALSDIMEHIQLSQGTPFVTVDNNGLEMAFSANTVERVQKKQEWLAQTKGTPKYSGCPAGVVFGGESAAKKMWDLSVIPARDILQMDLSPQRLATKKLVRRNY